MFFENFFTFKKNVSWKKNRNKFSLKNFSLKKNSNKFSLKPNLIQGNKVSRICYKCSQPIHLDDLFFTTSKHASHWSCFHCDSCQQNFGGKTDSVFILDDKFYDCDLLSFYPPCRRFPYIVIQPPTYRCENPIKDNFGGKSEELCWHSSCLTCECCNVNLSNEIFEILSEDPYCSHCVTSQMDKRGTLLGGKKIYFFFRVRKKN